jgi:hypothetical protein
MATNRSSINLIYQNALLSAFVSCKNGVSQSFHLKDYRCQHVFSKESHSEKDLFGVGWGKHLGSDSSKR